MSRSFLSRVNRLLNLLPNIKYQLTCCLLSAKLSQNLSPLSLPTLPLVNMRAQKEGSGAYSSLCHRLLNSIDCRTFTLSILYALHILLFSSLILSIISAYHLAHISTSSFPARNKKNTSTLTSQHYSVYSSIPLVSPTLIPPISSSTHKLTKYAEVSSALLTVTAAQPVSSHIQQIARDTSFARQTLHRQS